jgi:hypothetical protein
LSFDFTVEVSLSYSTIGRASVLYNIIPVPFWTLFCLSVLFVIPVIFKIL